MAMKTLTHALCLTILLGTATARADDDYTEAKQRMVEGKALFGEKRYEDSRRKMVQACAIMRTPKCLFGLALAEFHSDHPVEAYEHAREVLSGPEAGRFDPKSLKSLRDIVEQSYTRIGHLEIDADPAAKVFVDAKEVSLAAAPSVSVGVGPHALEARLGEKTVRADANGVAGQVTKVSLRESVVSSPTDATTVEVVVPIPPPNEAHAAEKSPSARLPLAIGLAAGGIAAVVGGAILGVQSRAAADDAKGFSPCELPNGCGAAQAKVDEMNRDARWSAVLYGGGALLFVGAAATWWFLKPSEKASPPRAVITPGLSSVHVSVRF